MMTAGQRILIQEDKRKRAALVPPSDTRGLAPFLIAGGLVLAIAGWTDIAFFFYPAQLSSREWEFGVIARTFDAMPLPTMGLLLLVLGVRARGGRPLWTRALSVVLALIAVACVVALVLFALDVPLAMRTVERTSSSPQASYIVTAGLERVIFKVFVFTIAYATAYAWFAIKLWRVPRE